MRRCVVLACVLAFVPSLTHADEIFLKGGGKLSGRILSRTDASVEVDVGPGIITVPMTSVLRIEERRSSLDEYYERAERLRAGDIKGWLELARWASSQGLGTQARVAYEQVMAVDPQNVDANAALGRVLLDGRWVSEAESYRARGYVHFEGDWLAPAELEVRLERLDAARQAEWARLDADRRVREAEARAAEAEARAREAEALAAQNAGGIPLWWGYWGTGIVSGPSYRHRKGSLQPWTSWPTGPLGLYPSQPLGMYPSQPIGMWPSAPTWPGPSKHRTGPPRSPTAPSRTETPSSGPRPRSAPRPAPRQPRG